MQDGDAPTTGAPAFPEPPIKLAPVFIHEGWLQKCSGGKTSGRSFGNVTRHWNRRYFTLDTDGHLNYYKTEADAAMHKPAGSLNCRGGTLGHGVDAQSEFAFSLAVRGRKLELRARSEEDVVVWAGKLGRLVVSRFDPGRASRHEMMDDDDADSDAGGDVAPSTEVPRSAAALTSGSSTDW